MSLSRRLSAAVAPALAAAGLLLSPTVGSAEQRPMTLTIAFTGDASGYLEPCG
jgi:hypothetical protein